MSGTTIRVIAALLAIAPAAACAQATTAPRQAPPPADTPALKELFAGSFLVGAALNEAQFSGRDSRGETLVKKHFDTISPENVLKWESVHPASGQYAFDAPDRYVDFGTRNGMFIVGHTLVWHNQTPRWVFEDAAGNPVSRDTLLARMRDHILTVVGRYKGRIGGWDVVNEALEEDGSLRQSPWLKIIGEDYIVKAYQYAHETDPAAQLYYNDYSLENAPKRDGAVALVKRLQAAGIPVAAVGLQGHDRLDWPTPEQQDTTIAAFAALGVQVMITELDIDVLPPVVQAGGAEVTLRAAASASNDPYTAGLPDSVQQALARQYGALFEVFMKHREHISRVTFWGVTDADSWLNDWPVRGRTSYPLLFDRQGQPKPAFDAVVRVARRPSATN